MPRIGDALFALSVTEGAIDIDHSLFAEGRSLTLPDFDPDLVEGLLQVENRRLVEAPQEIAGGRRGGYPFYIKGIKIDFILALALEVFERLAAGDCNTTRECGRTRSRASGA